MKEWTTKLRFRQGSKLIRDGVEDDPPQIDLDVFADINYSNGHIPQHVHTNNSSGYHLDIYPF